MYVHAPAEDVDDFVKVEFCQELGRGYDSTAINDTKITQVCKNYFFFSCMEYFW
jgi:hypothetical protein